LDENQVLTKKELMGWLSIIGIYSVVGFVLALPFLVLPDKIVALVVSNTLRMALGILVWSSDWKSRWEKPLVTWRHYGGC
jgi:hypothetical protein